LTGLILNLYWKNNNLEILKETHTLLYCRLQFYQGADFMVHVFKTSCLTVLTYHCCNYHKV